jgi:hypothetical protein
VPPPGPAAEDFSQMNAGTIIEPRLLRHGGQRCTSEWPLSPPGLFRARAEARALLYAAGELDLQEAVDALQAAAVVGGLVEEIGQDAVQLILAEVFARARG